MANNKIKNTPKQIQERREAIIRLMAHGYYLEGDIAEKLKISRRTVNSDMKYINEMNNKQFYELAKSTPSKVYSDCISDLDKLMQEGWKIYKDPATNANDKLLALKTISEINNKKFAILQELSNHQEHDLT
jgi:transcriptional antiterminator